MSLKKQFEIENFLTSFLWHILFVLLLLISVDNIFYKDKKIVTPDRIQIIEIDLKTVKISGEETKLQNTTLPEEKKEKQQLEESKKTEEKEVSEEPEKIENTTLVPEQKKEERIEKKQEPNLPRKKTVIKVNRETLSLDRTMTVSVVDALRVALTRCWVIDQNQFDVSDIRVTAHLNMLQTGVVDRIWFESASRAETDVAFAYVLDTVNSAIRNCQPFSMLPKNEYEKWKKITLTFYPSQGKIM